MRPTKFAGSGVGVGDSVGGSGVPIAIGALCGRSTAGSGGVVRKPLRIDTIETITRNDTHNRILSFHAPMKELRVNYCSKPAQITQIYRAFIAQGRVAGAAVVWCLQRTSLLPRADGAAMSAIAMCTMRIVLVARGLHQMLCHR